MNTDVFELFTLYLNKRLEKGIYTTEDSIRYSFFAALIEKETIYPWEIVQEFPHNHIENALVDTFTPKYQEGTAVFEFKYHREIPSGKNSPRPQKAGQIFRDLYRLLQFNSKEECVRLMIYVTDTEMRSYMLNKNNGLFDFFTLDTGKTLNIDFSYFKDKSLTFNRACGQPFQVEISCLWKKKLEAQHELRIFQIMDPISSHDVDQY
jgi:hypothetical protein